MNEKGRKTHQNKLILIGQSHSWTKKMNERDKESAREYGQEKQQKSEQTAKSIIYLYIVYIILFYMHNTIVLHFAMLY